VDKRYLLPIVAVVETMKWSPEVVMLQAHLPSLPGVSKDACLVSLIIGQGHVYSCTITAARTGAVLREQEVAYHAVEQCGDLEWSVGPAPRDPSPASQKNGSVQPNTTGKFASPIPSLRVTTLTNEILQPLAHPYQRVLRLVDGRRSVADIARLLGKQPQDIQQMLAAMPHLIQF
jgi:hypothetical protein